MNKIQVLDSVTIDKIAAGEVIERPASVVKELVENAIDAGSTAIVVEIKDGGISLIRITDNGSGIDREDVPAAFLRHSTSKIRTADDLVHIGSLGFRGEALSSIAAVSQVELITKTKEQTFGTRYRIAGGKEEDLEDTGAPDGTTFLVRQLFYNTPARRKFLKTPMTEASHVGDLMTRMALSHPDISFQFINNGQSKLHTSGNGNLKDVIYHIYGRDIAANLLSADYEASGIKVTGYLGKPLISRGNRNFENYYINGRYVKSSIISKAIEDAYKDFTMQHKYPFVVLHMDIDGESVDVNVHPTKMELRFNRQQEVYNTVYAAVDRGLHEKELIPHVE
ncbi:MAG: DNA mismatch repair endonuclease MutL, partial [Dorea sp.]